MNHWQRWRQTGWRCHLLFCPLVVAILLTGCAATPQTDRLLASGSDHLPTTRELDVVPFNPQEQYQCGPAALATLLQAEGVAVTPEELVSRVYLPARRGSLQLEMLATTRDYPVIARIVEPSLEAVLEEVAARNPVLVFQNLGLAWYPVWHYAVAVGYDLGREELMLRSGTTRRHRVAMEVFERTWQRADHWGMVLLRPGEVPTTGSETDYFLAVAVLTGHQPPEVLIQGFSAGLQRWPDSTVLGMGLGNLYYRTGQRELAAKTYLSILEKHPDYAPAHNNLAQVLHELGDSGLALEHARRALAASDAHSEQYRDTLETILSEETSLPAEEN